MFREDSLTARTVKDGEATQTSPQYVDRLVFRVPHCGVLGKRQRSRFMSVGKLPSELYQLGQLTSLNVNTNSLTGKKCSPLITVGRTLNVVMQSWK